jgi:cell migration-inducing and hyaluronan-binding protein
MSISVSELETGSWVIFELPGFTSATTGTPQDSLDALRNASSTSYYRGDGSLWVKLVSTGAGGGARGGRGGPGGGTTIQVNR